MALHERVTIRLYDNDKCFGPGMAQLLERVTEYHSLRAAAISMALAYSKAWTMVRRAEAELGFPLLVSTTGGKGGGGAKLTDEAAALLARYRRLQREVNSFAKERFEALFIDYI